MALWVSVHRIKKQPFFTLSDFFVLNYHEIRDHVITELQGIEELPDWPSIQEISRYVSRHAGEDKELYYDRALTVLAALKVYYAKYSGILHAQQDELNYLGDHKNYEELFFLKRCYELADQLRIPFGKEFEENDGFPILLTEDKLAVFNRISGQEIPFDSEYLYKLHIG